MTPWWHSPRRSLTPGSRHAQCRRCAAPDPWCLSVMAAPRVTSEGKPPKPWVPCCLSTGAPGAHQGRLSGLALESAHGCAMDIHSPRQLLAALAHILGFSPSDCTIVVVLDGARVELTLYGANADDIDVEIAAATMRRLDQPRFVVVRLTM